MVVTNPGIGARWAAPVLESLREAGYPPGICEIPEGEEHKRLDTVALIYDRLIAERHSRQSGLIALGGGVVGDIAGFAAATFLRGIAYNQLPTSLLAMVDSSVGGKTGVNHPRGKNLIGAFWQPTFVGIDLDFLTTLPEEELRAGMAEIIKYGVIADPDLFEYLEQCIEAAMARDPAVLGHLVARSCEIKAEVVARDEREADLRTILNYGHTFAHAVESLSRYGVVRHGVAVAMGMVAASRLAEAAGLVSTDATQRIESLLRRVGLPVHLPRFDVEAYWEAMGADKQVRDGRIRFVLPDRIGHVRVSDAAPRDVVLRVLDGCMAPSADSAQPDACKPSPKVGQ
jgi:3-dehydroquinate synthase